MADKIFRLGLGLLVWLWLARHLGPESFGVWNFAIAFAALFGAVAGLGLDGVMQRELVNDSANTDSLIGTAIMMRVTAGLVSGSLCVGIMLAFRNSDTLAIALVALNAATLPLQSSQVIDHYFQAQMKARLAVFAVNIAFVISTLIRLWLLWFGAALIWFGVTLLFEAALSAALLVVAYRADGRTPSRWQTRIHTARRLLKDSWPLLLSGIAVTIYMRIDQVMLAAIMGDAAVGQFSAAQRVSEVWYFIPMAIGTAAFPTMMAKRKEGVEAYEQYVQRLYDLMAWMGLVVAVTVSLIATQLIELLYGSAFEQAAVVLSVQAWAGIAVAMSFVHSKWLLAEGLQRYNLLYTLAGCIINLSLNLVLIPRFGAVGAAWATLASQIAPIGLQLLIREARRNLALMLNTVAAPYRYLRRRGV